jgi:hypothetical protein
MNIINSDIVTSEHDAIWADVSFLVNEPVHRPVLVVTNEHAPVNSGDGLLKKMLDACGLASGQYNIIYLKEGQKAAWYQLRELLDPKIILLFGILPAQLGISAMFRMNEPNHFNDRVWLPTLSIKELENNQVAKTQLWNNAMKPVFIEKKS